MQTDFYHFLQTDLHYTIREVCNKKCITPALHWEK